VLNPRLVRGGLKLAHTAPLEITSEIDLVTPVWHGGR
jgi:hypothetical protein